MNRFMIETQELPPKQSSRSIQETPSQASTQQDPLIAKGLQKEQYIGIFAFAIAIILAVGFFSRRVEYAILFAATLSIVLIIFTLIV